MKILLIEDDLHLAIALSRGLHTSYTVDSVETGAGGLVKAEEQQYAAIILDLNLPDISGLEVCKQLRDNNVTAPIIILTGESATPRKVSLFDAGADDYLTKPFSLEELKARLRGLIRRSGSANPVINRLVVGDLILDKAQHYVERAGRPISLRRKEFALLECLMSHAGTVVTRPILTSYAWDDDDDTWTNTVDVHIKYLRDKIDRPFDYPLIKTVHGLGYKLESSQTAAQITV